jgi:hypothetical protein
MSEIDPVADIEGASAKAVELKVEKVERRKGPRFDGYNPKKYYVIALAPVIILILGALPFHHFIVEVVLTNMVLNGLILAVLAAGIAAVFIRIISVQKQFAFLNQLTNAYTANTPIIEVMKDPKLYFSKVGHVVVHLAGTEGKVSSGLVQTAVNEELDHVQHYLHSTYEVPNFIVGLLIALGLTGTFIGLLETMLGISAMLGGINSGGGGDMTDAIMGLIGQLQKPLAGMGTAFSASLFGLVGSIAVGVMMLCLKYSVNQFMNELRRYIAAITEHEIEESQGKRVSARELMASRGGVSESFLSEFIVDVMDQQTQTQEVFRQSQENAIKLSVKIDRLADSINAVGELIKAQVETAKKMYDLLGYGPRMRDLAEQTLDEIKRLGDVQKLQGNLTGETTRAVSQLDQRIVSVNTQLSELTHWMGNDSEVKQGNAKNLLTAIGTLQDRMTQVAQETEQTRNVNIDMARHLSSQAESHKKLIELLGFGGRMRDIADQTLSEMKVLTAIQREESSAIGQLGTALGNIDQRFVRIGNQLAQLSTDLMSQGENGRADVKGMSQTLTTLQDQLMSLSKESSLGRQVAIDIARHLADANSKLQDLRASNELLSRIQDGTSGQSVVLDMMLSEIRTARTSIVRDLRTELREISRLAAAQTTQDTQES